MPREQQTIMRKMILDLKSTSPSWIGKFAFYSVTFVLLITDPAPEQILLYKVIE